MSGHTLKISRQTSLNDPRLMIGIEYLVTNIAKLITNIDKIENVQRYFTNKITGCRFRPYAERQICCLYIICWKFQHMIPTHNIVLLSLPTLQHRRLVADLTFLHHLTSDNDSAFLSPHLEYIPPSITRRHHLKKTIMKYINIITIV